MRVEQDAVRTVGIAVGILGKVFVKRTPCADVAPAEIAAAHIDVVRLLHDTVVYRNGTAFGVDACYSLLLPVGAVVSLDGGEELAGFGQHPVHGLQYRAGLPDEYS